ncbi:MAG TPA: phospho-N-acetylmuramoyl-pentapeptide-transferase [Polyangiaceae bacterium LLY-WYZ-15_(1-7)]|nr:phospho-N-acetylmuramoyl-pentapeptide-transferase [Sandaracinus sp.]HJK94675.1 phospho-N-acetylmuramoyl-pentapeptide-transferase [Polyangiaceae bacterium LLY-WYZ-15_(1-7)]MBJ73604.1 phospho-N-acetylmuramoyl-pentapeptide-transferase [Sandaracinus sp.]HJL01120.1 phospho-N-acetylmuramoyl-pentapeptide-transferase [Polyangiaceae bacterium LLY-WYZ-15_(1-7)]HJL09971.1 phospho-N-acetylmuramoyl-pentapeptide-transferase [Polyangiaceae bacterium LLY-WYZ-15_(1-7)]
MIYYLLYPLAEDFGVLNVLRYVPFRVLAATMTAMLLSFGLYPWFIRRLQSKQIGQVVRTEGPESHFSKAGTPTMGGALMLLAVVLSTVLWADPKNAMVWVVTAITACFGVVGYIDDAAKVRKKDTGGLAGRYKLLIQFSVSAAVCGWLFYGDAGLPPDWMEIRTRVSLPFVKFLTDDPEALTMPAWLYVVFASFVIVGTSNAVNLTDGLDGLAIGPVMINAGTYAILAYLGGAVLFEQPVAEYLFIPHLESASELAVFCASVIGVGFGFLWFNTYPAQVFMGDVGSLALGGGLGALAVVTKNELLSLLLGGIFVAEAVSVIVQVGSFKLTGKRVFLMAPIHHHFEKKGWPEPKVIVRFWIVSIMFAIASLATLKLR